MDGRDSLSLYLHIPFCRHRCAYCDFNTYASLGELKEVYSAALCKEIRQVAGQRRRPAHTVYFGGGTPSLMPIPSLESLMRSLRDCFELDPAAEITLEANPDTVDAGYLAQLRALGINRLSLGLQSAVPGELALLEREHDFKTVAQAVTLSRAAGFVNLNLDLIYGLPGQGLASWERSLLSALELAPDHLSLYCLTIEPGTAMHRWQQSGRFEPPDPDLAADQYDLACGMLSDQGFVHYEISNWALPGAECRHNLTYWRNGDYLGLGAGAHGKAAGYRYHVVKQPRVYIRRMTDGERGRYPWSAAQLGKHRISQSEAMSDTLITQLRLLGEGVGLDEFAARFGNSVAEAFPGTVDQLIGWGLLQEESGRLLLTRRGWFLSNQVFYRFI